MSSAAQAQVPHASTQQVLTDTDYENMTIQVLYYNIIHTTCTSIKYRLVTKKNSFASLSLSLSLSLCTHQWNDCEDYEIIRKVGRGKYSEVFEGWRVSSEDKVCVCVFVCVCREIVCVRESV